MRTTRWPTASTAYLHTPWDTIPLGGGVLRDDGYLEGPPQLVFEIAASTAAHDLHDKLRMYEAAGVPEYVVWTVFERDIAWFRLHDRRYQRVEPDANGIIESNLFPGLRLNVPAMLVGDGAAVLAALDA